MKRMFMGVLATVAAANLVVSAQGGDADKVLADARAAMGGNKLAQVTALTGAGRVLRTDQAGNTRENEFELSLQLPDRYLMRSVLMAMGNMSIYRNSGFNGDQLIEEIDQPPNLSGNHFMIKVRGPGDAPTELDKMTPEQRAEVDRKRVLVNKQDFARIALGMLAASPAFPLTFSYAGQAESPDGKADVLDVKGEGEFNARLFVDSQSHLPLMLSWTDKEPITIQMSAGSGGAGVQQKVIVGGGSGGATTTTRQFSAAGAKPPSKEDLDKMTKDIEAARKEAEAKPRRMVEFRVYYSDYKAVGGAMLPHQIQRSIDGKTIEQLVFDSIKVNPKLNADTFTPSKK